MWTAASASGDHPKEGANCPRGHSLPATSASGRESTPLPGWVVVDPRLTQGSTFIGTFCPKAFIGSQGRGDGNPNI